MLVFLLFRWCGQVVVSNRLASVKNGVEKPLVMRDACCFVYSRMGGGDHVEIVFAALRVPLAVPRLTGLPPAASLVAVGVFDRLVLRILKFVLDEIENVVRLLYEEYFVPSAVFRGSMGSEKSV